MNGVAQKYRNRVLATAATYVVYYRQHSFNSHKRRDSTLISCLKVLPSKKRCHLALLSLNHVALPHFLGLPCHYQPIESFLLDLKWIYGRALVSRPAFYFAVRMKPMAMPFLGLCSHGLSQCRHTAHRALRGVLAFPPPG